MLQHCCSNSHLMLISCAKLDIFRWASAVSRHFGCGCLLIYFPWGEHEHVGAVVDLAFYQESSWFCRKCRRIMTYCSWIMIKYANSTHQIRLVNMARWINWNNSLSWILIVLCSITSKHMQHLLNLIKLIILLRFTVTNLPHCCGWVKQIQGFNVLSTSNMPLIFHSRRLSATLTFSLTKAAAPR